MRKIKVVCESVRGEHEAVYTVRMLNDAGATELLKITSKYTVYEQAQLDVINSALVKNDMPTLTDDEIQWAISNHFCEPNADPFRYF